VLKILVSLLIALLLTTTGLRSDWQFFMPPLVLLVTLYWVMLGPSICGLGFAFSVGLVLDLLRDAPAGQHALAFCATVYLAQLLEYRVRHLGLAQQAVVAGILTLVCQLVVVAVGLVMEGGSLRLAHFHVVWGAMLAWPMVAFSLGRWHGRSW
jgi:rod shape-determining protein MreD